MFCECPPLAYGSDLTRRQGLTSMTHKHLREIRTGGRVSLFLSLGVGTLWLAFCSTAFLLPRETPAITWSHAGPSFSPNFSCPSLRTNDALRRRARHLEQVIPCNESHGSIPVVFIELPGIKIAGQSFFGYAMEIACELNDQVFAITVGGEEVPAVPSSCVQHFHVNVNDNNSNIAMAYKRFDGMYRHFSANPAAFEEFCIRRWLVLDAFLTENSFDQALYLDSDVLLFANASSDVSCGHDCQVHLHRTRSSASGHSSLWTRKAISEFATFILELYGERITVLQTMWDAYQAHYVKQQKRVRGGISDMAILNMFVVAKNSGRTCTFDPKVFDHRQAFADSDFLQDELGLPYRKDGENYVRMKSLHFQGGSKYDVLNKCPL
ncbi:hypothetical protein DFJ74DRAFT_164036 [Hyaloraphidium curvatum]|nr:hypothetical protein DFJ74DRAFT_164036 [Hyaloraphidium curvatum]